MDISLYIASISAAINSESYASKSILEIVDDPDKIQLIKDLYTAGYRNNIIQ